VDAIGFAREQLRQANEYLEQVMQDVTDEQAHWLPPGTALPIGAQYAHIVTGADGYVNGFLREGQPLFAGDWAGNVGVSALPPTDGADPSWAGWARSLRVDLPALRRYAEAVNGCIDGYLASLTPGEMKADDEQQMVQRLGPYLAGHVLQHAGEIACLKGLQGGRGYPD
jgi:hypothetical protein